MRASTDLGLAVLEMSDSSAKEFQNCEFTTGHYSYRVYFTWRGQEIVILLAGGDKSTQDADIKAAQKMVKLV